MEKEVSSFFISLHIEHIEDPQGVFSLPSASSLPLCCLYEGQGKNAINSFSGGVRRRKRNENTSIPLVRMVNKEIVRTGEMRSLVDRYLFMCTHKNMLYCTQYT